MPAPVFRTPPTVKHTKTSATEHAIGTLSGDPEGATVVAIAGLHGNEPTGVTAIEHIISLLKPYESSLKGSFIGLKGNLAALKKGVRFIDEDMNRLWSASTLDKVRRTDTGHFQSLERAQIKSLLEILDPVLENRQPECLYYVDLHTFSGSRGMFAITPKETGNSKLLSALGIPQIYGIEQSLIGTSMDYFSAAGQFAFAAETGTHQTPQATQNAIALLLMLLSEVRVLPGSIFPDLHFHRKYLNNIIGELPLRVELVYKHVIEPGDNFQMNPGFQNFDEVKQGQPLAADSCGTICALSDGILLMPLYQEQGNDGFFIVRECD